MRLHKGDYASLGLAPKKKAVISYLLLKLSEKQREHQNNKGFEFIEDDNTSYDYSSLPYQFKDPLKMDKKIDIKKMQFGSRIDTRESKREEYFIVKEVLSPEQLLLNNGVVVKLLGIKEKTETRNLAIEYLKEKFKKRKIYLKYDSLKYDIDNNLLCYVYLDNKTFINNHLVRTGYVAVDMELDYSCKEKFLKSLPA